VLFRSVQTMALLLGSPALNAGNNDVADLPTTDARGTGFPRVINGAVDLGAYEDPQIVTLDFTSANLSGDEAITSPEILRVITSDAAVIKGAITVELTVSGAQPADYTLSSPITIPAGTANNTAFAFPAAGFTIVDDNLLEGPETLTLTLSDPVGALPSANSATDYTIIDNDGSATVSIDDVTRAENADGGATTDFDFTVTLNISGGAVTDTFDVPYVTDGVTATIGTDLIDNDGSVTFPENSGDGATQTITITVNNDSNFEPTETFTVTLTGVTVSNGEAITVDGTNGTGTGTITDDDRIPYDVNLDGYVTPSDVTYVLNRLGADPAVGDNSFADVDNNGVINIVDSEGILARLGQSSTP